MGELNKKKWIVIIILTVVLIMLGNRNNIYAEDGSGEREKKIVDKKMVVVILSYDEWEKWGKDIVTGIKLCSAEIELKVEKLEYHLYNEEEYLKYKSDFFKYLYKDKEVDGIITVGEPAKKFIDIYGEDIFGEKQVVITGYPQMKDGVKDGQNYIELDLKLDGMISDIAKQNEKLNKIIIIGDENPLYEWGTEEVVANMEAEKEKVEIIRGKNIFTIINKIKAIPGEKVVLMEPMATMLKGYKMESQEYANIINKALNVPVYSFWAFYTRDALGGKFFKASDEGKLAAEIILGKKEYGRINTIAEPEWSFNYNMMEKYSLKLDSDMTYKIYNKPKEQSKFRWVIMIIITVVFFILINFLSFNIAKRKVAEKKMEISRIELDQVNENNKIRSDFFANVTHDIRTPIGVILSITQLLGILDSKDEQNQVKAKEYYRSISSNCHRLLRISNNLIDMTKIESGFMNLEKKNYEIIGLIENLVCSVSELTNSKGIELIFDTELEEKEVLCDGYKLERVVMNLLANAIKFTPQGGNITVFMYERNGYICISVKDSGIGIPEKKLQNIFNRYNMGDGNQKLNQYGAGIGLYIVKSIIDKHSGRVEVFSEEGAGTEFLCSIPIVVDENSEVIYTSMSDDYKEKINVEFSDI